MTKLKSLTVFLCIAVSIAALSFFVVSRMSSANPVEISPAKISKTETPPPDVNKSRSGQLIGYRHRGVRFGEKLPNGAQDQGGGLLSDEDYGVTRFKTEKSYMLWLEKIIDRSEEGVPMWEVLDVLEFDELEKNQEFLFSYSSPCRLKGEENLDLIVLAESSPKTKKYQPLKAWLAEIETEKFRSIPTDGVACE